MATLTEVGSIARNVIKYGTISLIILALIPGTIGLIKRIYAALNPPPPAPPTMAYGKLPKLQLPEAPNFATPEYKLETISGGLPGLPNVGKVYLVGINRSRLLTLDRMTGRARTAGFTDPPVQLDDKTYKYINTKLPAEMIFDIISGAIAYKYDWTGNQQVRTRTQVQIGDEAIAEARRFLDKLGVLQEDLARGSGKVVYLIASGSALIPTTAPYEANMVRVDLFRGPKDDLPIVTVGGDTSPVNVLLSSISGENQRVLQANYQYSQIMANDSATYPLKPVTTAWQELQSGGGFIAKRTTEQSVTIRKVELAYFESSQPQLFLQPVYLFSGDKGFMAYVHAIDVSSVQQ